MLLSIQKELLQIWALFLPLPPITGSGQCCAACQCKKILKKKIQKTGIPKEAAACGMSITAECYDFHKAERGKSQK